MLGLQGFSAYLLRPPEPCSRVGKEGILNYPSMACESTPPAHVWHRA